MFCNWHSTGHLPVLRRTLTRPYARVDRRKLKSKLLAECAEHGVRFHAASVRSYHHGRTLTTLTCQGGCEITARVVVDATGHARRLTEMEAEHCPGFQAAYGIMAGAHLWPQV